MATVLGQSDIDAPFSDCSIASLLPRTLGGSISAGAGMSESDDQDFVGNLLKSAKLKNYTQLVENAKLISNSSCSSFPNTGPEKRDNISVKRTFDDQIELQGKRARQRRPGLSSIERRDFVFNFPAETTAVEASQTKISDFSKRRSSYAESNSQAGPVIDYSCLENITDPTEYFSTHRMLENAEKELRRLKGEASPRLSQPQVRRDRQRRPGLPALEGKKYVFKFPDKFATVEASQMENATLSNGLNTTNLITSSCSKEICQTENSHTVEPERKLAGNAKTCELDADKDFDELERLLSKCRDLDNDEVGVENILRETLQINPIQVEKLRGFPFFAEAESTYKSIYSSITKGNKIDGFSDLKGRLTAINRQGNPFFLSIRDGEKNSDGSKELSSSGKDFCDVGTKTITGNDRGNHNVELENLKFDFKDFRVDEITKLKQETLKTTLLDAKEMTNPVDNISTFKRPIPFIDVQGRLDKLSTSINHIFQSSTECESLKFSNNDFEDFSLSKIREAHSLSPVDAVHLDKSFLDVENTCAPLFSNDKQLSFEDAAHSPAIGNLKENRDIFNGKTSEPKGHQIPLLEIEICSRLDGLICDKELVSDVNFVEASTDTQEKQIQSEVCKDLCLPENSNVVDEQVEAPCNALNGSSKNQRQSEASGGSRHKKLKRKEQILKRQSLAGVRQSTRNRKKPLQFWCGERDLYGLEHDNLCLPENSYVVDEQVEAPCNVLNGSSKNQRHLEASGGSRRKKFKRKEQILKRKSLAGAGTVWEAGVRRSTRIRMKPLQFWCGERVLYGRVHDSLATVIGVKKFGTPLTGKNAEMEVKSFVSEQYADLVAKAALH